MFLLTLPIVPGFTQQVPPDVAVVRNQVDGFLRENPSVARYIESRTIARENLEWMFRTAATPRGEDQPGVRGDGVAQSRAACVLKAALKVMADTEKLKHEQTVDLHDIVFPKENDWEARWEA